jgi:hypothetical protein
VRWLGIEAARWWSRGGAQWGCAPVRERRRGELGEGRDAPGVLGWGLLLGPGWRGVAEGGGETAGDGAASMAG